MLSQEYFFDLEKNIKIFILATLLRFVKCSGRTTKYFLSDKGIFNTNRPHIIADLQQKIAFIRESINNRHKEDSDVCSLIESISHFIKHVEEDINLPEKMFYNLQGYQSFQFVNSPRSKFNDYDDFDHLLKELKGLNGLQFYEGIPQEYKTPAFKDVVLDAVSKDISLYSPGSAAFSSGLVDIESYLWEDYKETCLQTVDDKLKLKSFFSNFCHTGLKKRLNSWFDSLQSGEFIELSPIEVDYVCYSGTAMNCYMT